MAIYCPSCGTEAAETQQFCRKCGVNLSLIGKALSLSESIGRGDRGPFPKVKSLIDSIKLDQVGEEVDRALEQMNREIEQSFETGKSRQHRGWAWMAEPATPQERKASLISAGATSLFGGIALMIVLYVLAGTIVLKIPPEKAARIPFELEPLIRMAWILGLLPALKGFGQLVGGLLIKPGPAEIAPSRTAGLPEAERAPEPPQSAPRFEQGEPQRTPPSVTEHTTAFLEEDRPAQRARTTREH